jgi:hypothetical protein
MMIALTVGMCLLAAVVFGSVFRGLFGGLVRSLRSER